MSIKSISQVNVQRLRMAPHPGVDTDAIKEKARKDLLNLLEGVCKASLPSAYIKHSLIICRYVGERT